MADAPEPQYLGNPNEEKAACGLGFIANKDGVASREVILQGGSILNSVVHRGAVGADGSTGDGAGIMTQIPYKLLAADPALQNKDFSFERGDIGLGQFYLPQDETLRAQAIEIIEAQLRAQGITNFAFRDVPTDPSVISETAKSSMPVMKQIVFSRPESTLKENFEALAQDVLFGIEKAVAASPNPELKRKFYTPSFSTETVVYKGLLRSDQLTKFYPDFSNPLFESAFALVHNRFSTNTISQWKSAQPFRTLAHNGEINTIKGNTTRWLIERQEVNGEQFFIDPQYSDSARLDLALTAELMKGRSLDEAVLSLVAPAWRNDPSFTQEMRDFFKHEAIQQDSFCGPAMLIMTNGRQIIGHTDSFGLRPATFLETTNQILFASEFGTVRLPESEIKRRMNVSAGGIFVFDFDKLELRINEEVFRDVASRRDYGALLSVRAVELQDIEPEATSNPFFRGHMDRMRACGVTSDVRDYALLPVIDQGKPAQAAMGPQVPLAPLSMFAQPLSSYIAQLFAEVSNPPLASGEEKSSMSLYTYLGANPKKINDAKFIELPSPLLRPGNLEAICNQKEIPVSTLDITYNPFDGEEGLAKALRDLGAKAVEAVGKGPHILILSDRNMDAKAGCIDATLATAAVDYYLRQANLSMNTSIIVDTGQVMTTHQEAVLLSMGANAVNPYLVYDEARIRAGTLKKDPVKALKDLANVWDAGLLKVMSKMGIPDVMAYARTGRQVEARGLNLQGDFGAYMGNMDSKWGGHGMREISQNLAVKHALALLKMGERGRHLLENTELMNSSTKPGDYWYEVAGMFISMARLTTETEALTRLGTFVDRSGGEPRMRDADTITEYRAVEHANTKEESYLITELREAIGEIKKAATTVTSIEKSSIIDRVLRNMSTYMTPEYEELKLGADLKYSTDHLRQLVTVAIMNEKVPGYLEKREEIAARNAWGYETAADVRTTKGYRYSSEEIAENRISPAMMRHYERMAQRRSDHPNTFVDLLAFEPKRMPVAIEEVVSTEKLLGLFNSAGMSDGAIQYKPHATIGRITNNVGARSNSGEGGERAQRNPGGLDEDARSPIRQCASGRWGYTVEYMTGSDEIEIKVAQGAKPGEGGELPPGKNTPQTARNRYAMPGVSLVSPPPHHDMYSIEDLEQLILDISRVIKQEHAKGKKVAVKLVATDGIGTIAAGVAKAGADVITIAGNSGGTGAANLESIHHAGMPVHQGVREVHQTLVMQNLRDKVKIRQSGDLSTPRDAMLAYAMGADQIEIGTDVLVRAGGCVVAQNCNIGCPVFLTTEGDKSNRPDRTGERELITFMDATRAEMARFGYRSPEEIRGKVHEFVRLRSKEELSEIGIRGDYDFSRFLAEPQLPVVRGMAPEAIQYHRPPAKDDEVIARLDPIIRELKELYKDKHAWREAMESGNYPKLEIDVGLCNCDRSFGAKLAGYLAQHFYDPRNLLVEANAINLEQTSRQIRMPIPDDLITIRTRGEAGNSYGAFNFPGVTLLHEGPANCYVGKGMTGGRIAIMPDRESGKDYVPEENAALTNLALFGATGGKLYVWGGAGERFALRDSGATSVIVGDVGAYDKEYGARGSMILIGDPGPNFGKNMTGGVVAIYDPENKIKQQDGADVLTIGDFQTTFRTKLKGEEERGEPINNELYQVIQAELETFAKLARRPAMEIEGRQIPERKCQKVEDILFNLDREIYKFKFIVPKGMSINMSQRQMDSVLSSFSGQPTSLMEDALMQMYGGTQDAAQR